MTKIPSGGPHHTRLPPQPKGPHKTHEPRRKTNTSQASDPQGIDVDIPVDSLDRSRAIGETSSGGQGGFGERAPHDPKAAISEEPLLERRSLTSNDSLAVVLDEIKLRLERLSHTMPAAEQTGPLTLPTEQQSRVIPRAETVGELRDLLRQTLAGDFGFTLANTPQITFGALFSRIASWPEDVPPHRAATKDAPWQEKDWQALLTWVMTPPPMPEDLLKF